MARLVANKPIHSLLCELGSRQWACSSLLPAYSFFNLMGVSSAKRTRKCKVPYVAAPLQHLRCLCARVCGFFFIIQVSVRPPHLQHHSSASTISYSYPPCSPPPSLIRAGFCHSPLYVHIPCCCCSSASTSMRSRHFSVVWLFLGGILSTSFMHLS
jgi:hypothetical protein